MPAIILHPLDPKRTLSHPGSLNPLPRLLHTPSGLAILELQGTINMPDPASSTPSTSIEDQQTPVGRLVFPDYSSIDSADDNAWMKRVYLYVGKHQRLTGEVKRLPNPMALFRRRGGESQSAVEMKDVSQEEEELEIVEVVRWKILFSQRPEPVGS